MYHEYSTTHAPVPADAQGQPPAVLTPATPCPGCGDTAPPLVGPGTGPHYAAARCAACLAFLRWLPTPRPVEGTVRHG